jgi:hypothetical protein
MLRFSYWPCRSLLMTSAARLWPNHLKGSPKAELVVGDGELRPLNKPAFAQSFAAICRMRPSTAVADQLLGIQDCLTL